MGSAYEWRSHTMMSNLKQESKLSFAGLGNVSIKMVSVTQQKNESMDLLFTQLFCSVKRDLSGTQFLPLSLVVMG